MIIARKKKICEKEKIKRIEKRIIKELMESQKEMEKGRGKILKSFRDLR